MLCLSDVKVVFPLRWLCWDGGRALIALPGESCAPAALSSCHLVRWSQGVIPKHVTLLGRAPSLWNQGADSPNPVYCGPVLGVWLQWCLDHFQDHSLLVLNNCGHAESVVQSYRFQEVWQSSFMSSSLYFLHFPLGWLIWSVVHTHTNLLSKRLVCHTLTVLFGTHFLVFL